MIVVYHDVHSVAKLQEIAKIVFAYDNVDLFVISRPQGAAAQTGVPEIHLAAAKRGKKILIVPDLKDVVELLKPKNVFIITKKAEKEFDPAEVGDGDMVVVAGTEPDATKFDIDGLEARKILPQGMGDVGYMATVLCKLSK
ncbi:MAG: hypothetical protein PWP76_278 [Candidatus Diapherotrites archaeon]|nr:hypothetical protein [Candidatus Diapherotrites archaeon]